MRNLLLIFYFLGIWTISLGQTNTFPLSGNTGIGTTSPSSLLHLYQSANYHNLIITDLASGMANNFAGLSIRAANTEFMGIKGNPYTGELRLGGFNMEGYFTTIYSNNQESVRITGGKMGIGTPNPYSRLHIFGGDIFLGTDTYAGQNDSGRILRMYQNDDSSPSLLLGASYSSDVAGTTFSRMRINGASSGALVFELGNGNIFTGSGDPLYYNEAMRISSAGNIGIGTISPTEKLSVNGKIRAKEINVQTGWSDFVFEPTYKLGSLKETETFIKENGHLPEIPSAKEVAENGINVGEMNSKLLQKIEELTLHLINQHKEIESLKKQMQGKKDK